MSEIYYWLVGVLWGLVNYLFWARIKRIEKDIESNFKTSERIEHNYLDRFEKLTGKLNEVEKNIIREIALTFRQRSTTTSPSNRVGKQRKDD